MPITWYESDDDSEEEVVDKVIAFTGKCDSYSESSDEEIWLEALDEMEGIFLKIRETKEDHTCFTPWKREVWFNHSRSGRGSHIVKVQILQYDKICLYV